MNCPRPMSKSPRWTPATAAMAAAGVSAHPATQAAPTAPRASTRPNLSPATTTRPAGNAPRPTRPMRQETTGAPAPATPSNASPTARFRPARLHHRRRTRRQVHRHHLRLLGRRPRLPPQIRQRQHRLHRRQQADHRFRQGRAEAGAGRVCGAGGVGGLLCPAVAPGCHSAIHPTPSPFPIPPPGNPRISPHAARRRPCGSARSWRFRAAAGSRAGRRGCARCRAGSRLPSPRPPSR
jgi:hypothetical protein